jgi:16S rRNA (adenine1518-N6/adenine1519-N6)-dimethyltransferase
VFIIKSGSFYPKPKVDSAFIRITLRKDRLLNRIEEDKFFRIVRAAFNQRRKTLKNSLKNIIPPDALQGILSEMSVDPGIRPEMLSLEDFLTIAKKAKNQL